MILRRRALALVIAILAIAAWACFLRPSTNPPTVEIGDDPTHVTMDRHLLVEPPDFSNVSRSITPTETELDRLEREFYQEFPLALKFRDYKEGVGRSPETEALAERFKDYTDEPNDVPTKNLRNGHLNVILELEMTLMIKELFITDSDLGQMLHVAFKAPQWDWSHMLRNSDNRIFGGSAPAEPVVETVEQLLGAIEEREQRILDYASEKQKEALMPDFIREDIRQLALQMLTGGVTKAYLETITPRELVEARLKAALPTSSVSE